MGRPVITMQDARDLPFEELLERVREMLEPYDKPPVENDQERLGRLELTIDQMPEIYRFLLQLYSWCDHWTDAMNEQMGTKDRRYRAFRQRRDFFEKMASAAKQRYEAASRLITIMMGFDASGMPRSRRAPGE